MTALDKLKTGTLAETLAALKDEVRNDPSDPKHRVFLFQLLAVLGEWEKAGTQLQVVKDLDKDALMMVQAYEQALNCERLRAAVLRSERSPMIFGEPEAWIAQLIEALRLFNLNELEKAAEVRAEAFEAAPATSGKLFRFSEEEQPGEAFEWMADADPRLGPILEAYVNGKLYWVPLHRIKKIDFERPTDLRDVVWTPVHFTWSTGGETVGFIPTRYDGSESSNDDQLRMARKTDWNERSPDFYLPIGQRMLATDTDEYPLLGIEKIEFDISEESSSAGT